VISEGKATVDIALPVLNEERGLEHNVRTLLAALSPDLGYDWSLTVVDNGSSDGSWEIASRLARTEANVRALRLGQRGRGGALKVAWMSSAADIVAYMDIDLSTDLEALGPLLDPIAAGTTDLCIGSRLMDRSQVTRGARREVISRLYNMIARAGLRYGVRDAQCGFKAIHRNAAQAIVPKVHDDGWFFDTELLALAWRHGMRITEIPVRWVEDDDSRVRIVRTALDDLGGIVRLMRTNDLGQSRPDTDEARTRVVVEAVSMANAGLPGEPPGADSLAGKS
jgi:glycosyltransferase involved in cell wall biosynthesis